MISASIDLGTNTCLLLIAETNSEKSGISRVLGDFTTIVRLGEGVDQKRELQSAPIERTLNCLKSYALKIREFGISPEEVKCVATSQARDAKNSGKFFSLIREETGFNFHILTGEEEARLTFLGALHSDMRPESSLVIDIGGGSTELISSNDCLSIDIGSVRFTERYLNQSDPVTDKEFWACQDAIDKALEAAIPWRKKIADFSTLVAVAGTATTLAAWHLGLKEFDPQKVDSVSLSRGDLHRMVEELKWRTVEERRRLPGMEPLRADVIWREP